MPNLPNLLQLNPHTNFQQQAPLNHYHYCFNLLDYFWQAPHQQFESFSYPHRGLQVLLEFEEVLKLDYRMDIFVNLFVGLTLAISSSTQNGKYDDMEALV